MWRHITCCYNIHAVLHGAFHRTLMYSYTNSSVNFSHHKASIWFCYVLLLATRSSLSSASARTSQRTCQLGCDSLTQGVTENSRSSENVPQSASQTWRRAHKWQSKSQATSCFRQYGDRRSVTGHRAMSTPSRCGVKCLFK